LIAETDLEIRSRRWDVSRKSNEFGGL